MKNFRNLTAPTTYPGAIKTRLWEGLEGNARGVAEGEKFNPFGGLGPTYAGAGASAVGNGAGQSAQDADGNPFDNPSSAEINRLLNPDG